MLEQICRKLGTYTQSVKNLARRFCDLYRRNPTIKLSREPKTIKGFQTLLGYGNYYSFKKQVYAIMIVSTYGNLAEIVDDPDAHILKLLPQTIVLDPPEQAEFNSFLEELKSEFERRTATLVTTPIGGALGAVGGAFADPDCPPRGAGIGAFFGSILGLTLGTAIDVWMRVGNAQQAPAFCERIGPLATCPKCNVLIPFPHGTRRRCPGCDTLYFRDSSSGELQPLEMPRRTRELLKERRGNSASPRGQRITFNFA